VLSPGMQFCPECGRPVSQKAPNPLLWVIGGLVGLIIIFLLILLLRPRKQPPVVNATPFQPKGPPVVAASPRPPGGPPVVNAPPRSNAPEDPNRAAVAAYLSKMADIEARRKQIVNNLYPAMLTMALLKNMGGMQDMLQMLDEDVDQEQKKKQEPSSVDKAQSTIESYRSQFRALAMDVQKIPPPPPAQVFHNGYLYSLGAYDAVIGEIQDAMVASDQSIASKGGELKGRVNQALKATDDELARLLQRYHLTRSFTVSDDMAGNLTGVSPF
jgi:hypothetical protein